MLRVARLDRGHVIVEEIQHISDIHVYEKVWIDVVNPTEEELNEISKEMQLHSVTREDISGARVRVKVEEFKNYTYIVFKGINEATSFGFEQINFVLTDTVLLTFSYFPRKHFLHLREDIERLTSLLTDGVGMEYLLHHLIDFETDRFFGYFDTVYKQIDDFEYATFEKDNSDDLSPIYETKKQLIKAKKAVTGIRDVMRILAERRIQHVDASVMIYFRDVYDHLILLSEIVDSYRDLVNSSLEVHLAVSSNKTNDIVKILTIVTTMFMPLTFITGLYGMNFAFMPELHSRFGYPIVVLVMILIEVAMLVYFKKKKWI